MIWSNFLCWAGNMVAVLKPSLFSPLIISITSTFWGPGDIATRALFQKELTERQRATIASINAFVSSLLFAAFALFIGKIADSYGPLIALLVVQLFIFPTIILQWRMYQRNKKVNRRT